MIIGQTNRKRPYMNLPLSGDTNDHSLNKHSITNNGGVSATGIVGQSNGAYEFFDPDYLNVASSIGNTIAQYLNSKSTILWFNNLQSTASNRVIARQYQGSGNRSWFINNSGASEAVSFGKDTGSNTTFVISTDTSKNDIWEFISTRTSGANGIDVSIQTGNSFYNETLSKIAKEDSNTSVTIAGRGDAGDSSLNGKLVSFRVYGDFLSEGILKVIEYQKGRIKA